MTTRPRAGQRTSRAGVELIKTFEGFRPRAARLPDGRHVVGYGHTQSAREGVRIAEADAHALLIYDLLTVEAAINEWVFAPLTQNQFDALVSFAFNIGLNAFRRSDVLRRINEGSLLQAAGALEMWRLADLDGQPVVIDALVRRRAAEKALFLTPSEGFAPAPGVILRPQVDFSAYASVPRHRPEEVTVPLDGDEVVVTRGGALPPEPEEPATTPEPASEPEQAALGEIEPETADLEPEAAPEPAMADLTPEADLDAEAAPEPDAAVAPGDLEVAEALAQPEPTPVTEEAFPFAATAAETPQDDDDEDWTAARAAAAAVSARLHQILSQSAFNDDEEEEPSVEILSHPSPPQSAEETASAALPEVQPFPPAAIDDETHTPYVQPFPATPAADEGALRDEPRPVDLGAFEPTPAPVDSQPTAPYLLLGLVGLLFIIAALVSLFRSPAEGAASMDGVSAVSWILGLLGVAGVSGALWLMLRREELDEEDDAA